MADSTSPMMPGVARIAGGPVRWGRRCVVAVESPSPRFSQRNDALNRLGLVDRLRLVAQVLPGWRREREALDGAALADTI